MASITSGEMAECDWLSSDFQRLIIFLYSPLGKNKGMHFETNPKN
jgi:hypothetical protein